MTTTRHCWRRGEFLFRLKVLCVGKRTHSLLLPTARKLIPVMPKTEPKPVPCNDQHRIRKRVARKRILTAQDPQIH